MIKMALTAAALAGGLIALPGVASAASPAIVTTDLNIRTGPGTGYQAFDVIPAGGRVTVYGCATGYNWCDIAWAGTRGWVSGNYLAYRESGRYYDRPIGSVGGYVGVPVISFSIGDYHDRWYRGRSWYRDRDDWRDARREWRQDRRDDRRDVRRERRDVRDARRDLREARRDGDPNLRQERRQLRQERRELRQERREFRRDWR